MKCERVLWGFLQDWIKQGFVGLGRAVDRVHAKDTDQTTPNL